MFAQTKATLIQVQFIPKCGFILISTGKAKVHEPQLARFALYNSPAWRM